MDILTTNKDRFVTLIGVIILSISMYSCIKGQGAMEIDSKVTPVSGIIAFSSDRGGAIFSLNGGIIEKLTLQGGNGRFSSDGKKIFYCMGSELFTYDLTTGERDALTQIDEFNIGQFDLSPDDKQIVFASYGRKFDHDIPQNIYVVNIDGTDYKQLTFFTGGAKGWNAKGAARPRWSPDGKTIVFVGPDIIGRSSMPDAIYTIKSNGTELKKIIGPGKIYNPSNPSWSPDSKRIVFSALLKNDKHGYRSVWTANDDGTNAQTRIWSYKYIFTANADGSDIVQVTTKQYNDTDPVFSPNGRQICFASHRHYTRDKIPNPIGAELYVINADGTDEIQITPTTILGKDNVISPHLSKYANDSSPDWHE
ncbi:MAG: hypothetical protein PHQ61_08470 [Candidatus Omnitrophica bacterium]|nr:hypothetical protein [Candidatus Omnitrophota bacterium]